MVPWVDWASGCSSRLRRITRATIAAPKAANPNHFFLEAMRQEYAVLRWEGATRSCQQDKTLPATSCPQEKTPDKTLPATRYPLPARNDARRGSQFPVSSKKRHPTRRGPRAAGSGQRTAGSLPRMLTVGWCEMVGLPALGIDAIAAKVDTGASSSSIDATRIHEVPGAPVRTVRFQIHLDDGRGITAQAPVHDIRTVRNPGRGGREEQRYVIRTDLSLGGESWPVEVTLARRTRMDYRMLIGREALGGRAVVDPAVAYHLGAP